MSDSVEEVKVSENAVAEVTGVSEHQEVNQEKEDLVDKILRDLSIPPVVKSEEEMTQATAELNKLEELKTELESQKTELEAKVESLEKENAQLEKENAELLSEEKEVKETVEAADTPDEEESEEGEEEEEEEEGEERVRYLPVVVVKERDNGLPFPIVCASSLLIIVYLFKAFLFLCAMTGCNCNRNCICLG